MRAMKVERRSPNMLGSWEGRQEGRCKDKQGKAVGGQWVMEKTLEPQFGGEGEGKHPSRTFHTFGKAGLAALWRGGGSFWI